MTAKPDLREECRQARFPYPPRSFQCLCGFSHFEHDEACFRVSTVLTRRRGGRGEEKGTSLKPPRSPRLRVNLPWSRVSSRRFSARAENGQDDRDSCSARFLRKLSAELNPQNATQATATSRTRTHF